LKNRFPFPILLFIAHQNHILSVFHFLGQKAVETTSTGRVLSFSFFCRKTKIDISLYIQGEREIFCSAKINKIHTTEQIINWGRNSSSRPQRIETLKRTTPRKELRMANRYRQAAGAQRQNKSFITILRLSPTTLAYGNAFLNQSRQSVESKYQCWI
jgi:hypothetical protein